MKHIYIFSLLLQFCITAISQTTNYKITYRHNLQWDTLKILKDTIGKEAILIGNSFSSNYSFAKAPIQVEPVSKNEERNIQDIINAKQSGTYTIKGNAIKFDSIGNMVYQNKRNKQISVREKMMNEYIITEELAPIINWTITEEIRMIKNYTCKKATTHFRGRDYVAWFTTDIPIVASPWKFFGLPGLVMDIEDSKNQVKIYVEKIEYPVKEEVPNFVNNGTKISIDTYFTFRNEELKKYTKGMQEALMQQDNMQAILDQGGKKPTVKTKGTMYSIEIRLD